MQIMDRETTEWLRIIYPKTFQWKLIKFCETLQNMFYWWK